MISAFDVYLVMQLDSVGTFLTVAFLIGIVVCILLAIFGGINGNSSRMYPSLDSSQREAAVSAAQLSMARKLIIPVLLVGVFNSLIPSSKTAAALIILPALTSDAAFEAVAPEARELYELAKDALRSVASKPEAEKPEK